jgi:hypothetical protein
MIFIFDIREKFSPVFFYYIKNWFVLLLLMIPSLYNALEQGVELGTSLTYVYPLLIFPIYLVATSKLVTRDIINSGKYFCIFILFLFVFRTFNIGPIDTFFNYLIDQKNAGFFSEKVSFFSMPLQGIYFKATLLLVPIGILSIFEKRWVILMLIFAALFVAPSRTGIIVIVIFLLVHLFKHKILYMLLVFLLLILIFAYILLYSSNELILDFLVGGSTRMLHVDAVIDYFTAHPNYFFFGGGAGSVFYTEAFSLQENLGFTDDIEISQLEILRRYGVFFLVYLFFVFYKVGRGLWINGRKDLTLALILYFLVSASNPVLLTAPAVLFYSVILNELEKSSRNNLMSKRYEF